MTNASRIARLCARAHDLLASYYRWETGAPDFDPFLVPGEPRGEGGAVVFEEDTAADSLFIGLRFDGVLLERVERGSAGRHELAVVAEETSHFMTLLHAAEKGARVTHLEIETLGEIDRFLFLLHAGGGAGIPTLCDAIFSGPRFVISASTGLYVEAEACAFHHLREAFGHVWQEARFDPSHPDGRASRYLEEYRRSVLGLTRAA